MKRIAKKLLSIVMCMAFAITAIGTYTSYAAETPTVSATAVYIDGYPDKTFLPEKFMTRAEAIKVTAVICGYNNMYGSSKVKTNFTDVVGDEWYAPYVKYLETFDMVSFFGDALEPGKEITRAEFVKLISPLIEKASGTPKFSDVTSDHKYYTSIIKAARAKIVEGYPDGTFRPDGTLKRAEIVTMLNRVAKRNPVSVNLNKIAKFTDIDTHWAKSTILAAASKSTESGLLLWYTGDAYAATSQVDKSTLDYSTTEAILKGIDKTNADAVEDSIEAYTEKRRQEIANTKTEVTVKGTKYYVSEDGNDSNDGKSPEKAWKTLAKVSSASLKSGDGVFFKRGDTFRGQLVAQSGVTYSAYGEGAKPNLYGSLKNYSEDSSFWVPAGGNKYISKEKFDLDVGLIVFNDGEAWTKKKAIGINGTSVSADLEMYHNTTTKKIELYSKTDPNTRFTSTEICFDKHVVTGKPDATSKNIVLDNLCIKYTGAHGVGFGKGTNGLTVQNCEIGWIGGSLQRTGEDPVRYGNGIEIYNSCNNYTVNNCHIYQVYDAGVTHQYFASNPTGGDYISMTNINYTNNVIEYCTYAIEYVNSMAEGNGIMAGVNISGNILAHSGDGWGKQRPPRNGSLTAVIKGWGATNPSQSFVIYDNVVFAKNTSTLLIQMAVENVKNMPELTGNIFCAKERSTFGVYGPLAESPTITHDSKIFNNTVGLDDNTFVYVK